jgi:hypothetical protein
MNLTKSFRRTLMVLSAICVASIASAIPMDVAPDGTVSHDGADREAWLKSAIGGFTNPDNPGLADVEAAFGGDWVAEGQLTGNGTNDWLTINLTSGVWGGNGPITGTWTIADAFWLTYGRGVITMHVGNGNGDPDGFMWEITTNALNGTFYYNDKDHKGGGLSNLKLWGSGDPTTVPDSGTSAILVGLGLISLGLFRRKLV